MKHTPKWPLAKQKKLPLSQPLRRFPLFNTKKWQRITRRPLIAIPLITAGALTILTFAVFTTIHFTGTNSALRPTDSHIVLLSYDEKKEILPSTARTVGALLQRMDIKLANGDRVEPSANTTILEDNFHINVYRALPVTIVDGTQLTTALSAATTPRSLAAQAGVTTYPEDTLTIEPVDNFVTEGAIGQRIIINRATPVTMNLYGTMATVRTHAKTVGDLLKDKKIKLAKDDSVQPAAETALTPNSQVFIVRKGVQIATVEQEIPAPTEIVEDSSLTFGATAVRQQGSAGKKLITYQVQLQNGVEVSRTEIQQVVTVQPVATITARGKAVQIPSDIMAVLSQAGVAASDYPYVNYIVNHEGGWCPTKWQGQHDCPAYYVPLHDESAGYGYGICQSTPANKMASAGDDWRTNVVTQLRWCSGYATRRYGSWQAAYNHWLQSGNW